MKVANKVLDSRQVRDTEEFSFDARIYRGKFLDSTQRFVIIEKFNDDGETVGIIEKVIRGKNSGEAVEKARNFIEQVVKDNEN